MHPLFLLPLALIVFSAAALAQPSSSGMLESVVVIDSQAADAVVPPQWLIGGDELDRRRETTIGEMLRGAPGVSATGFGTNASRPIVRGQDADRVKILQNGSPDQDISAMSFDHAVAINPFAIDQVEMLRGASVLLYGGNPLGGAINLVDRRIPKGPVGESSRSIDLRMDSANRGRQLGAELEAGTAQGISWHVDAFAQKNDDTRTPRFTDPEGVTGRRVRNTSAESQGAGLGFSKSFGGSVWGASVENFQTQYGVPKETGVRLDMNRSRLAIAGDQWIDTGLFEKARIRMGTTEYRHSEIEDGVIGTTFKNNAHDIRIELLQRLIAGWKGVIGMQWDRTDLQVAGEEALLPNNTGQRLAVFMLQERALGPGRVKLSARLEDVKAASATSFALTESAIDKSGPAIRRSFLPASLAAEFQYSVAATTQASLSLSHVQRAPSNAELFSMGIHRPSGVFEAGNSDLKNERGHHVDVGLTHQEGPHQFKASVFASRYSNYLALIRRPGDSSYEGFHIYDYTGVGAEFHGLELEYKSTQRLGQWNATPRAVVDHIVGKRTTDQARIPRLTPTRLTLAADFAKAGVLLRPEVQLVGAAKLGDGETAAAPGYAMVNFLSEYRQGQQIWFLKGQNLTDKLAFRATTVDEVRLYSPMAGRSVQAGWKIIF